MKTKRILLVMLIFALVMALFVGCDNGGKTQQNAKVYTLTFETNSETKIDPIIDEAGKPIPEIKTPTKKGYYFLKWSLSPSGDGEAAIIPTVMPSKNMTFYAIWTKEASTITLDANGGELDIKTVTGATGRNMLEFLASQPNGAIPKTEEGITFDGWYLDGEKINETTLVPSTNITLVAHYNATYKINIYKQNILDDEYAVETTEKTAAVGETVEEEYQQFEGFERVVGEDDGDKASLTLGMTSKDNKIDVYYDRVKAEVKYSNGGATGDPIVESKKYGAEIALNNNAFEYANHRFAGWKRSGKIYEEGATIEVVANIEFTATWDEKFADKSGGIDIIWLLANESNAAELEREGLPSQRGSVSGDTVTFRLGRTLRARLTRANNEFLWDAGVSGSYRRYTDGTPSNDSLQMYDFYAYITIDNLQKRVDFYFDNALDAYVLTANSDKYFANLFEKDGQKYFYLWEDFENTYFCSVGGNDYQIILVDGNAQIFKCGGEPSYIDRALVGGGSYVESDGVYALTANIDDQEAAAIFSSAQFKISANSKRIILKNDDLCRKFTLSGGGELTLDGFDKGVYSKGGDKSGDYVVKSDGNVALYLDDGVYFFNISSSSATLQNVAQYATYATEDKLELFTLDGAGGGKYIDLRGRVSYIDYQKQSYDDKQFVIRFAKSDVLYAYRLADEGGVAVKAGLEVGEYSNGADKLLLDGAGKAIFTSGGVSDEGTYTKSTARPYDYTFEGKETFRFLPDGNNYKKYDESIAGNYTGKFITGEKLYLSGYGEAELIVGGITTTYDSVAHSNDGIIDLDGKKCKIRKNDSGEGGVFVMYNASETAPISKYDSSVYNLSQGNVASSVTLQRDGYDGFKVVGGGENLQGVVMSISNGVYSATLLDGSAYKFKIYDLVYKNGGQTVEKTVFAPYKESDETSYTQGDSTLALNGYGEARYTLSAEDEGKSGYYCYWDETLVVFGGEFDETAYFSVDASSKTCERAIDFVIESGVLKLYIGRGGGAQQTVPSGVSEVAANAFEGSAIENLNLAEVRTIGDRAFYNCTLLNNLTALNVAEIGEEAFVGCAALSSLELNVVRTIGASAFKDLAIHVTIGNSLESIGDKAFSHGENVDMYVDWTIGFVGNYQSLPELTGDPFEYTGRNNSDDLFAFRVTTTPILERMYGDATWRAHADHIGFVGTEPLGTLYLVADLEAVRFGRMARFADKSWAYLAREDDPTSLTFYTYDATVQGNHMLTYRATKGAAYLDIDSSRYYFVGAGAEMSYESNDGETLTFTMPEGEEVSALFNGTPVTFSKADLAFELGGYVYTLTLTADHKFSYKKEYIRTLMGEYRHAEHDDGNITLYYLNTEQTDFALEGNKLYTTYIINNEDIVIDLANASAVYLQRVGAAYRFYVFEGKENLYMVDITISTGTEYTASTRQILTGNTYTMDAGLGTDILGDITIYTDTSGAVNAVAIETRHSDGNTYFIHASIDRATNNFTVSGDYPADLLGTYHLSGSGSTYWVTRA